jgi:hypothetical protein
MATMPNKNRSPQTPHLADNIETGCLIDGSHQHVDDFSVAVLRYAEFLGYQIDDADLVHVLIREMPHLRDKLGADYNEEYGHWLSIVSDEAVDWLNRHVATEPFSFYIDESSLFLEEGTK